MAVAISDCPEFYAFVGMVKQGAAVLDTLPAAGTANNLVTSVKREKTNKMQK